VTSVLDSLSIWMATKEGERLEFKEAKNRYDFEKLVRYCAALANEGGGRLILGVTDKWPRRVVGTLAFLDMEHTKAALIERLRLRIDVDVAQHPSGRVLIFEVPPRPIGMPVGYKGAYWMRGGEDLVAMTPDRLKHIFAEGSLDFSAEVCPGAALSDLDPAAIKRFRDMWRRKSGNDALNHLADPQLLIDAELVTNTGITYAALVLLGTPEGLGKHLAQAEVVLEYRSGEASLPHQQREEYRQGFFLFDDPLWKTINLRNDVQHYQDGLFVWDIRTFNEMVVREAILNAISHRDYRLAGSVFVRQFPRMIEIVSPGGFPPGITPENILWRQSPRNRRIAEVFSRCGLVERSGQGANRMFEECIKESKPRPDFTGTDEHQVSLTLRGDVQDPYFLRFLEQVGKETLASFSTRDLLILDWVHRDEAVPPEFRERLRLLRERGIVETTGRGRGTRHILSRRLYTFMGQKGLYTRKRGLDRETNKALLLQHVETFGRARIKEFEEALPGLTRGQVHSLLRALRGEGKVRRIGEKRGSAWERV